MVSVIRGMGIYRDGKRVSDEFMMRGDLPGDPGLAADIRRMAQLAAAEPGTFAWIGLAHPTVLEVNLIGEVFDLEALYLDDSLNSHQPTKLDPRDDYDFLVMKILTYVESTSDVETGQLSVFVGEHFIITVRLGPLGDLDDVRRELENDPEMMKHGPPAVLHAIMDHLADSYLDVADEINHDIELLEENIFSPAPSNPESVYRLKRENLELRRAAEPLSRVAGELRLVGPTHLRETFGPLFGDVRDHLLRVKESTETNDTMLMALLMAATARQDLQQNSDMRKISAYVAMAAVPTMIAGIYGMNFENMPELDQPWGYPLILGIMIVAVFGLYRAFKRSGWL
jgi:magnesium transporter